jgi:hypothetical protein
MNETAHHFLDCYMRGAEPDGGWTFPKALRQAQLDYTPASLQRVNLLLDEIRARLSPQRDAFLAMPGARNFCALLAYYLVAYVAKRSGARFDWHDAAAAQQVLGTEARLPQASMARIVAIAGDAGVALLPLGWIEEKLFGGGAAPDCTDYLAEAAAQLDHAGPFVWAAGARCAGLLASHALYLLSWGEAFPPTVLLPDARGECTTFVPLPDDGSGSALRQGRDALADAAQNHPYAAFAHHAHVMLPSGRASDAVLVELRCHGDAPLALTVAFPFRSASDPRGFAIHDAERFEGEVPPEAQALFAQALDAGIADFEWPSGSWSHYRVAGPDARVEA